MDNVELWDAAIELARRELALDYQVLGVPETGPEKLDTATAITGTLAKLVVLLVYQKARVEQMELGRDYTMVRSWTKRTEEMVESLGVGSIGIARRLAQLGYSTMPK